MRLTVSWRIVGYTEVIQFDGLSSKCNTRTGCRRAAELRQPAHSHAKTGLFIVGASPRHYRNINGFFGFMYSDGKREARTLPRAANLA
jgi:hypothetical protein